MKEIGLKLKEKREENGVSVEEAAEDLKVRPAQIEALESGNRDEFKDVAMLKYLIRDYAKYLGLDGEDIVDEFNEYLFDITSKITANEVETIKTKAADRVASPYTKVTNKKGNGKKIALVVAILVVIAAIIGYLVASKMQRSDFLDNNTTYIIRR